MISLSMSWLIYALLAPATYAVVNFTDKYIVEKELQDYRVIPVYTTITAFVIGTLIWLLTGMQTLGLSDALLIIGSGIIALWSLVVYFKALSYEETSKVIILIQVTPIFTLILGYLFLREVISLKQFLGFALVLISSLFVSWEKDAKIFSLSPSFWWMMLFDVMLAISYIMVSFVVNQTSFSPIFSYESWGVGVGGLIFLLFYPKLLGAFQKTLKTLKLRTILILFVNELLFVLSKAFTFFSFALGPTVLVNVINTTQVFFGIAYGFVLMQIAPKIFQEDVSQSGLLRKIFFASLMFIGIWLVY